MKRDNHKYDVLIVGAGMAGLTIASELTRNRQFNWLMLDKGRSVGGRMATRRIDDHKFDHGAQFFTTRSDVFKRVVDEWLRAGVVREWCRGFNADDGQSDSDGFPRYMAVGGMNQLPKWMASQLPSERILVGEKILRITREANSWTLESESGGTWSATNVVLTMPIPQVLQLLEPLRSRESMSSLWASLAAVDYDPCIAVMGVFGQDASSHLVRPCKYGEGPLAFISDNGLKGVSSQPSALTIHLSPDTSRKLFDSADDEILELTLGALRQKFGKDIIPQPNPWQVHRWRYASPRNVISEAFIEWPAPAGNDVTIERVSRLVIAGEAFSGPKIEGAFLSGLAAGQRLSAL